MLIDISNFRSIIKRLFWYAIFPLVWVIGNEIDEFSFNFIILSLVVASLVVLLESIFLYSIHCLMRGCTKYISDITFSGIYILLCIINVWTFGVCSMDLRLRSAVFLSILLVLITNYALNSTKYHKFILVFASFMLIISFVNGFFPLYDNIAAGTENKDSASKNITNEEKRNVYVLVFDSLVSETAYREAYKHNATPWSRYLSNKKFNVIENAQSAGNVTGISFKTLYGFGAFKPDVEMTGSNNPVYEYFAKEGYKVAFITDNGYFGSKKGVQANYLFTGGADNGVCSFAPRFFLFGICDFLNSENAIDHDSAVSEFSKYIKSRDKSVKWLTTVYIWYPGHSPGLDEYEYDNNLMSQAFATKFTADANKTTKMIDSLLENIFSEDKDPIIFVFGDHGSWFYRVGFDSGQSVSSKLENIDQFGVTFGFYPKNICLNKFTGNYEIKNLFVDAKGCGLF